MADPAKQIRTNQFVTIGMGVVLIFGAVSAVTVTASEYDPSSLVWMHLGIDLLMTVLLPVMLYQVAGAEDAGGLKTVALVLGGVGLLAGLVKLAARFSRDHGW
jgi:chloramphenicol 3-O-phosphotransferase